MNGCGDPSGSGPPRAGRTPPGPRAGGGDLESAGLEHARGAASVDEPRRGWRHTANGSRSSRRRPGHVRCSRWPCRRPLRDGALVAPSTEMHVHRKATALSRPLRGGAHHRSTSRAPAPDRRATALRDLRAGALAPRSIEMANERIGERRRFASRAEERPPRAAVAVAVACVSASDPRRTRALRP